MAMDVASGIMLPVDAESDKMTVVPKSTKLADESGIVRFGIFFLKKLSAFHTEVRIQCSK